MPMLWGEVCCGAHVHVLYLPLPPTPVHAGEMQPDLKREGGAVVLAHTAAS